jgi:hypothetical protein
MLMNPFLPISQIVTHTPFSETLKDSAIPVRLSEAGGHFLKKLSTLRQRRKTRHSLTQQAILDCQRDLRRAKMPLVCTYAKFGHSPIYSFLLFFSLFS